MTRPEKQDIDDHETLEINDENAPTIDPDNPNIITTAEERHLFRICQEILPEEDLQPKDNENYYSILYEGRPTRWLLRFRGDRKRPSLQFSQTFTSTHKEEILRAGLELTKSDHIIIDKPENLYRLVGLLKDALQYCKDNENFRRGARKTQEISESIRPAIRAIK